MWLNRKETPLPKESCVIWAKFENGHIHLCRWFPFDVNNYYPDTMPGEGYLGTARVIDGRFTGIGFHAWTQNNSEFIEYKIVTYGN